MGLFEEIAKIGKAGVRPIHGDFSSARSNHRNEVGNPATRLTGSA